MNSQEVQAFGAPTGAKAIGVVQWVSSAQRHDPDDPEQKTMMPAGTTRTDYLLSTDGNQFAIVGLKFRAKAIRFSDVSSVKIWYW